MKEYYLPYVSCLTSCHIINQTWLMDFNFKLSFELWEDIFEGNDVNKIFKYF